MAGRLVVVGGDAAGMSAASQARRRREPGDLDIVALERGNFTSYSACGIPYFVGRAVDDVDRLIVRTPQQFLEQGIDARVRHEVTEIDVDAQQVVVRDLERSSDERIGYDYLMIATGAVPIRPPLEGSDSEGIFGVQTLDHGVAIAREIDERKPRRAAVIGGGYVGLEMAEAFKSIGMEVTLVEKAPQLMTSLDPDMGALVADATRGFGIDVRLDEPLLGFDTSGGRVEAVVTNGGAIPVDIVALGLGVRPNVALVEAAGIPLGSAGGVKVDDELRTAVDGVWSAGDCAEKWHRVSRTWRTVPLGTHANKEGRVAGINIAGGRAKFPGVLGTAASKVCATEIARTGLTEAEASDAGCGSIGVVIESTTRAGYFPGAAPIKAKLIAERRSGRLLGAQIVGREGAAKRIDVVAAALWNEMTVDELVNLDLAYAPPFSPVWDPVLIAARKAAQRVAEDRDAGNPAGSA